MMIADLTKFHILLLFIWLVCTLRMNLIELRKRWREIRNGSVDSISYSSPPRVKQSKWSVNHSILISEKIGFYPGFWSLPLQDSINYVASSDTCFFSLYANLSSHRASVEMMRININTQWPQSIVFVLVEHR